MIKKTPRQLPPLADMLRDMGATIHDASRALHVAPSTLYRWHNTGTPRAAALGLYWMTSWGVSELVEDAIWRARLAEDLVRAQERELKSLRAQLVKLGAIGEFGSANDPMQMVSVSQRDRALLLRNEASAESSPMRVTIPNASQRGGMGS